MILRSVKWLFLCIALLILLLMVSAFTLTAMTVQTYPLVAPSVTAKLDGADSVNELIAQLKTAFSDSEQSHDVKLTQTQVESLVGVMHRALPEFKGVVNISPAAGTINVTYAIKQTGYFINATALVIPGKGLNIEYVKFGNVTFSGQFIIGLMEWIANTYTQSQVATIALSRVEKVSMREGELTLEVGRLDALLTELNIAANNISVNEEVELEILTAYYLRYISGRDIALSTKPVSLIEYLREGMARAREQSDTPKQAVLHNKAVIIALAIYVGHYRIGNLVGNVQPDNEKALKPRRGAVLHNRNDLARHFIISAALEVLSEQGVSLAIGEFKELMDRAKGGSGYSFVDLAADMSGVAFASIAVSEHRALEVQNTVARIQSELEIIPPIQGLPEGLSKKAFKQQYIKVDSDAYLKEVAEIKRRISTLALYAD